MSALSQEYGYIALSKRATRTTYEDIGNTKRSILLTMKKIFTTSALGNDTNQLSSLRFKEAVENNPFNVLASWNSSTHFCKWHGVTCSLNHQRFSALNLQGYALRGLITPEIALITNQHTEHNQQQTLTETKEDEEIT
ncbi:hypothetical protein JHK85_028663 [Glycine max]|nr:hypothetical protein JHK85_028663 [Glycine max]